MRDEEVLNLQYKRLFVHIISFFAIRDTVGRARDNLDSCLHRNDGIIFS